MSTGVSSPRREAEKNWIIVIHFLVCAENLGVFDSCAAPTILEENNSD